MHKDAPAAHQAAQCAHDQGKFWEFHDKVFGSQRSLEDSNFKQYAADLELDTEAFNACYDSGKFRQAVLENTREGKSYGVTGTPAFFINGRFLSGAQPYEKFAEIIDDELER